MARRSQTKQDITEELLALEGLSVDELRERWFDLYGSACSINISQIVLRRALAHRIQEQALGGLDRKTERLLKKAAKDLAAGRPLDVAATKTKPGTRLLREWQGRVHEVIVLEKGVEYREKTWPSLSAVAPEITGTRWSGPRFFGLKEGL